MCKYNVTFLHMITQEVMTHINVLSFGVMYKVFRDIDGTGVVALDFHCRELDPKIFKLLIKPKQLATTHSSGNVLSFSIGYGD